MLAKTLENPLGYKEIKPVNPKGNQSWILIGRTDSEAEALILLPPVWPNVWPNVWPHMYDSPNGWLIRKDPAGGKDWKQEEKGWQRMRWLNVITDIMDVSLSQLWQMVKDREAWYVAVHGVAKSRTRLRNWTTAKVYEDNTLLMDGVKVERSERRLLKKTISELTRPVERSN